MSLCEQSLNHLKDILEAIPNDCWFKLHGSYHHFVYPGWKSGLQINDDLHILYVSDGEGYYHMEDGTNIPLRKGSLIFVSHGYKHFASFNAHNPVCFFGLRFGIYGHDGLNLTKQRSKSFFCNTFIEYQPHYHEIPRIIHMLFHQKRELISQTMCSMLLYQILFILYQALSDTSPKIHIDSKMEKARRIISENPYKKISIHQLAESIGVSTRYLQKKFKETFGFTPKEYHMHIQMDMAFSLIKEENISIMKLAELMGYNDPFSFSKQFKKHFGYPPRQVKKIGNHT